MDLTGQFTQTVNWIATVLYRACSKNEHAMLQILNEMLDCHIYKKKTGLIMPIRQDRRSSIIRQVREPDCVTS